MEDGVFEHAQFFFSYGDGEAMNEFVALARRKGFGTIAMKTTRGAARMREDRGLHEETSRRGPRRTTRWPGG